MHTARVSLRVPEDSLHPMHAFVCESPSVDREVILERDARGAETTMLLFVEGDLAAYRRVLNDVEHVQEWTLERTSEGGYVYVHTQLRQREQRYRDALDREHVLVVPPVELRADRTIRQTLVGESEQLSRAIEDIPEDVGVEVLSTGSYRRNTHDPLSSRQREAVQAAWDVGYFELPRSGDLEAVATRLDCSTSTASDLLRRAQRQLAAAALGTPR